jgi:GH25 family lysozyme M1 (1,4-beta-N-acetylmuramidase)
VIRLRRRRGIAGTILIALIVVGLALAAAAQSGARGSAALAATTQPLVQGTDVSNLTTGTYNWPDVKAAGMSFVGIFAYDGASVSNPIYASQVTGALSQGLYVMPYVVADPLKVATGADQFTEKAWPAINGVSGAPYKKGGQYLPIVLDMESQPLVTSEACYGLTQAQMVTWISQFITAANKQTGLSTVIYSNPNWWQACTGNTTAASVIDEPLWIADYGVTSPAIPPGWPGYTFWQSSDSGTVNGIPGGSADLDNMLGAPATETAGTTGSVQLETLNSLAGQSVSYASAGSLPSGFALSAAGKLSWSSAQVGTYSMAFTPASTGAPAGAVTPTSTAGTTAPATVTPSSVAVNLRVHGAISVANTARSSTVGTPVWFGVATSGPDQNAGVKPTLKATGLPTGTSINSAGLITGWPTRYGTFKVTVTASDALGGTGSASFTWTVKAAADAGTAGQIRQVGGSGKCLDDPSGKTANGTHIDLSSCTGKANQRWTLVQDGTLRTGGACLGTVGNSTSSGAKVQLQPCNSDDGSELWQATAYGQLDNPQSGKCLDAHVASAANGTQPVIEPCTDAASARWLRPAAPLTSGEPGKCVGTSGTEAALATCSTSSWQHWQPQANGTVSVNGWCLTEAGTTAGSKLSLLAAASCASAGTDKWKLVPDGLIVTELVNTASGLCAADPATGTQLVIEPCTTAATDTWRFE